jgi:S-DNA-T family DNA segregation ATPase FtsK/SpoIIIE
VAKRRTPSAQRGGSAGGASRSARSGRGAAHGGRASSSFPFWPLTTDIKIDLIGGLLVLLGVLTFLGIIIQSTNLVARAWLDLWRRLFGWGLIAVPLVLVLAGAWLIARRFEDRLPRVSPGQWIGGVMLAIGVLTLLHALLRPTDLQAGTLLAAQGKGGGLVGAAVLALLVGTLGGLGAAVALFAWHLIAGMLVTRRSLPELLAAIESRWPRGKKATTPDGLRTSGAPDTRRPRPSAASPSLTLPAHAPSPLAIPGEIAPGVSGRRGVLAQESAGPAEPKATAWVLPDITAILEPGVEGKADEAFDRERSRVIEETLLSFGAPAHVVEINRGPTITQFGVEPGFLDGRGGARTKIKVSKISALADDLALALAAPSIRVEAPVPGKGYVGIEVPNLEITLVALRDVMLSKEAERVHSPLRLALGRDVSGKPIAADLASMPHLLIAGTTGSGKSVCVNAIVACLLLQNTPDELNFVMVDPKRVELTFYNGIPHLRAPVVVDLERIVPTLQWVSREMDERYRTFAAEGVRNLSEYNARQATRGMKGKPCLVVVIDELADLMMLAPDETERVITRLAQLARATGIHLVIATQRPSVDVVTGLIKANFPARIAFAVASSVDSRVILDQPGAERLLGRGDMLFQAPDAPAPVRMQGAFVAEGELSALVQHWKDAALGAGEVSVRATAAAGSVMPGGPLKQGALWEEIAAAQAEEGRDVLYDEAVSIVRSMRRASISLLQRRLRIGYTRAARLVDQLEERGIIGPAKEGSQAREVLDYGNLPDAGEAPGADR